MLNVVFLLLITEDGVQICKVTNFSCICEILWVFLYIFIYVAVF